MFKINNTISIKSLYYLLRAIEKFEIVKKKLEIQNI